VDGRLAASGQAYTAGSSSSSTLRDEPIQDDDAHINLPAGCQVLDGPNALGFACAPVSTTRPHTSASWSSSAS
jgi:hypothetical protein